MPLNLKKYDGRYVGVLYGSTVIAGKLRVEEGGVMLEEAATTGSSLDFGLLGSSYADSRQFEHTKSMEINAENINAIRDITNEIYESLDLHEGDAKRMPRGEPGYRDGRIELARLSRLRTDIEQIRGK